MFSNPVENCKISMSTNMSHITIYARDASTSESPSHSLLHWQSNSTYARLKLIKKNLILRAGYIHFTVLRWFNLTSSAEMTMSLHEAMIGQSILFWLNGDQWIMAELILFQNEEAGLLWTSAITVLSPPAQTV